MATNSIYLPSLLQNPAPAQYGPNHLMVTYGQQRRIFDTAATSVTGIPQQQSHSPSTFQPYGLYQNQPPQYQQNVFTPFRQACPCVVTYSFPNPEQPAANGFRELGIDFYGSPQNFNPTALQQPFQSQYEPNQLQLPMQSLRQTQVQQTPQVPCNLLSVQPHAQPQYQPVQPQIPQFPGQIPPPPQVLTLEQQIALNELHKHALETMLLHETFKRNPFSLRFHLDGQTDTNDLPWCGYNYFNSDLIPIKETKVDISENSQNPESLHSEAAKRKTLVLQKDNVDSTKQSQDKEAQSVPDIMSVEVQCVAKIEDVCTCKCTICKCEKEMQTERRVTFQKEPEKVPKKSSKHKRTSHSKRSMNNDSDSSSAYDDVATG